MKKVVLTTVVVLSCVACSKPNGSTGTTSASASAATPSATVAAKAPSLLDKALSFVTGGPFEGEITMSISDANKPPQTIVYSVKGAKMRFDVPGHGPEGDSYAIFDAPAKKITTVTESKKMAFVMDMNAMPAGMPGMSPQKAKAKPEVTKTGKMETIAGYTCEDWTIKDSDGDQGEACMAKGIAFPSMGPQNAWAAEMGDNFPLRVTMNDKTGKQKTKMEVTKIEKKTIDEKKLEVPAGYKTINMRDMMKSLGGMSGLHAPPHMPH